MGGFSKSGKIGVMATAIAGLFFCLLGCLIGTSDAAILILLYLVCATVNLGLVIPLWISWVKNGKDHDCCIGIVITGMTAALMMIVSLFLLPILYLLAAAGEIIACICGIVSDKWSSGNSRQGAYMQNPQQPMQNQFYSNQPYPQQPVQNQPQQGAQNDRNNNNMQ